MRGLGGQAGGAWEGGAVLSQGSLGCVCVCVWPGWSAIVLFPINAALTKNPTSSEQHPIILIDELCARAALAPTAFIPSEPGVWPASCHCRRCHHHGFFIMIILSVYSGLATGERPSPRVHSKVKGSQSVGSDRMSVGSCLGPHVACRR